MTSGEYFTAGEHEALRMESELLALENNFLKSRIRALDEELRQARETEAKLKEQVDRLRAQERGESRL
jgi:hypothetical protein